MPLPNNFDYNSIEFISIKNNDLNFILNNLDYYSNEIDKWLTIATYYSNLDIIKLFVNNNANPIAYLDENFNNAIKNDMSVLSYFIDNKFYNTNLNSHYLGGSVSLAVETKNINILKTVISLGFDFHLDNDYALQHAVSINFFEGVKYLLSLDKFNFNLNNYFLDILILNDSYDSLILVLNHNNVISISIEQHHNILKSTPKIFDLLFSYFDFNFNKYCIIYYSYNISLYNHIKSKHYLLYSKMISIIQNNDNDNSLPDLFIKNELFFINNFNLWKNLEIINLYISKEEILKGLFTSYLKSKNDIYINIFFNSLNDYHLTINSTSLLEFLDLHILSINELSIFPNIVKTISTSLPLNSPYPNINRALLFFNLYEKF